MSLCAYIFAGFGSACIHAGAVRATHILGATKMLAQNSRGPSAGKHVPTTNSAAAVLVCACGGIKLVTELYGRGAFVHPAVAGRPAGRAVCWKAPTNHRQPIASVWFWGWTGGRAQLGKHTQNTFALSGLSNMSAPPYCQFPSVFIVFMHF